MLQSPILGTPTRRPSQFSNPCRRFRSNSKNQSRLDRKFEDVVKSAQDAAVLVLVY